MGQAWQKKGKRVSRGTKSEMSTTKGQKQGKREGQSLGQAE